MRMCSLSSGSSANSIYVGSGSTNVLIDAGLSGAATQRGLNSFGYSMEDMDAVFITHEHSDHIRGLGVLSRRWKKEVYATAGTIRGIERSSCRVDPGLFHEVRPDEERDFGSLRVLPIRTSHDAGEPVGYKFRDASGCCMGIMTDLGCFDDYTVESLKGVQALILEANHDVRMLEAGPYPYALKNRIRSEKGHLSNEQCAVLLLKLMEKNPELSCVILGHLSQENNYEALALETVRQAAKRGEREMGRKAPRILVAGRDRRSELVEL